MKYKTFQQKLNRLKSEPIGFLVKSKEIADELAKVFEKEGMEKNKGDIRECLEEALREADRYPGYAYVIYNASQEMTLTHGTSDFMGELNKYRDLLDVTLDELKEYLESTEDFKDSEQEEHMKITIETDGHHKTTAECNGITAESLCNPADEFKLPKGVHMAVQRLLEKLEEVTCFHVGDTVEVVGYHNKFLKDIVGKRGVVTRIDERTSEKYEIKYEENISGDNRWWSRPEELKLISEEDTGFHVGDIVEVVANEFNLGGNPVGLQGVIKWSNSHGANVELPTRDDLLTFYNRELKLIRRGNN